jgi:hypothetical protein
MVGGFEKVIVGNEDLGWEKEIERGTIEVGGSEWRENDCILMFFMLFLLVNGSFDDNDDKNLWVLIFNFFFYEYDECYEFFGWLKICDFFMNFIDDDFLNFEVKILDYVFWRWRRRRGKKMKKMNEWRKKMKKWWRNEGRRWRNINKILLVMVHW